MGFTRFQKANGGVMMKLLSDNMESISPTRVKNVVCQINDFTACLVKNDTDLSYNGFEIRLIIHSIDLLRNERIEMPKDITNIFEDNDFLKNSVNVYAKMNCSQPSSSYQEIC